MTDETKSMILSPSTLLPVGVLAALLMPLIAGVWMAAMTFSQFTGRLGSLEDAVRQETWTYEMERESWTIVQRLNPGFNAPDAREIRNSQRDR